MAGEQSCGKEPGSTGLQQAQCESAECPGSPEGNSHPRMPETVKSASQKK